MKRIWMLVLCAGVAMLNGAPALARGVGVEVDGRSYTFVQWPGDETARYEVDGKTFYIGEDEVVVREPGKPERHFQLGEATSADASATEEAQPGAAERVSEVIVSSDDDSSGVYYIREDGAIAQEANSESAEDAYYITEGGAIAQEATSASVSQDASGTRDWSAEEAAEYAVFAPYGLSCDAQAGKLYYLGEPVRVFEDVRRVDGGTAELGYFDASGSVDVRSVRDESGALTGLEALSEAEFEVRDLRKWTDPEPTQLEATASSGTEPTPEERAAFFAPYAAFGLRYDAERDRLYVNDRPVREFLDVRSSNGEPMSGGKFRGSITQLRFEGEVDVTVLRDYEQTDGKGEGKIIGIEVSEAK